MGKAGGAKRVLFIGDSLTYVNDLDQQVLALARLAGLGAGLTIDRVVKGARWVLGAGCESARVLVRAGGSGSQLSGRRTWKSSVYI